MKFKFLLSFLFFFGAITLSHASFPVKRTVATTTTLSDNISSDVGSDEFYSPAAKASDDKVVGILLWVFLWPFAAHRWYYGKPIGWNILFILTFGGLGVWAIVDLVNIITDNF
ncbi:TM2 domain-containing protein [Psychroserpens luteus]|uniref:TM2 domain-containing protein n=1 Tax=Psychroserpens luteus TaxID=1434066 RepID=A0ABW5ZN44_9FLAO|nr:TM2 domain-containing protein [Psychroserpens luteus]